MASQYKDAIDDELVASLPTEMRGLRACIPCMLVKTYAQFYEQVIFRHTGTTHFVEYSPQAIAINVGLREL